FLLADGDFGATGEHDTSVVRRTISGERFVRCDRPAPAGPVASFPDESVADGDHFKSTVIEREHMLRCVETLYDAGGIERNGGRSTSRTIKCHDPSFWLPAAPSAKPDAHAPGLASWGELPSLSPATRVSRSVGGSAYAPYHMCRPACKDSPASGANC